MPMIDYRCSQCGKAFEEFFHPSADGFSSYPDSMICLECGQMATRERSTRPPNTKHRGSTKLLENLSTQLGVRVSSVSEADAVASSKGMVRVDAREYVDMPVVKDSRAPSERWDKATTEKFESMVYKFERENEGRSGAEEA